MKPRRPYDGRRLPFGAQLPIVGSVGRRSERLSEILTPPALEGKGDDAHRAQAWTATCLIAAPISTSFAVLRLAGGEGWLALVDLVGAIGFIGSAAYLQRTGHVTRSVDLASLVGLLLLTQAAVLGGGLYAPAVAWYGLIPLTASLGLGRRRGMRWSVLVVPLPLILFGADVLGWVSGRLEGDPARLVSHTLFLAGVGAVAWSYETLADQVRTERDEAIAQLQEERKKTDDLLLHRNQFVKNVSHEIRTPLNHILGAAQLLTDTRLDEEQLELVSMAASSGHALLGIIDGAIAVHDAQSGQTVLDNEPIDLQVLLTRLSRRYGAKARAKGLQFRLEIDTALPARVEGDAKRVEQILVHLLDNAVAFTAAGSVQLRAVAKDEDRVRFEVEDTGIGIDPSHLETIFEPFRQLDESDTRRHGGLGAGLTLCRRLARLMDGDVRVKSTPGAGSTFTFEALLPKERITDPSAQRNGTTASRPRATRVLLAEPNPRTRQGFLGTLERMGLTAEGVADQDTLRDRASSGAFDIVFVDLDLPGSTPLADTVRMLSGSTGHRAHLVALTRTEQSAAVPDGFDDQLPKPLRREQVVETLRRIAETGRRVSLS